MAIARRRVMLGAVAFLSSATAFSEPARPQIALSASSASGCPSEEELVARVTRRLLPASIVDPAERFEVAVELRPDVTSAALLVTRADGSVASRTVQGASCDDVFETVAFIVAMTIDPATASQPPEASPPASSSSPTVEHVVPLAAALPLASTAPAQGSAASRRDDQGDVAAPRERRLRRASEFQLGAYVDGTTAIAPYLAPVFRVSFAARFPLRRLVPAFRVGLLRSLANDVTVDEKRGATFTFTAARAEGCVGPTLTSDRWHFEGCAGADVGALRAKGTGVAPKHDETRPWVSLNGLGRVGYTPVRRLVVETDAGLVAPLIRDEFELHAPEALVFKPPSVALTVGVGVALRLD